MPTISMFYGIIIRMYYAPGGILSLIFMCILQSIRLQSISGRAKYQKDHFRRNRQNLFLPGRNCIRMN